MWFNMYEMRDSKRVGINWQRHINQSWLMCLTDKSEEKANRMGIELIH